VHNAAAVAGSQGPMLLERRGIGSSTGVGSVVHRTRSPPSANTTHEMMQIPTVDLVRYLLAALDAPHRSGASVVLRMDAEGSEYSILPAISAAGVGRRLQERGRKLILLVEWHVAAEPARAGLANIRALEGSIALHANAVSCARARTPWFSTSCSKIALDDSILLAKDTPGSDGSSSLVNFGAGRRNESDPNAWEKVLRWEAEALLWNGSVAGCTGWNNLARTAELRKHYPRMSASMLRGK